MRQPVRQVIRIIRVRRRRGIKTAPVRGVVKRIRTARILRQRVKATTGIPIRRLRRSNVVRPAGRVARHRSRQKPNIVGRVERIISIGRVERLLSGIRRAPARGVGGHTRTAEIPRPPVKARGGIQEVRVKVSSESGVCLCSLTGRTPFFLYSIMGKGYPITEDAVCQC